MNAARQDTRRETSLEPSKFLDLLFEPNWVGEFRLIESWKQDGRTSSRLVDRLWCEAAEFARYEARLRAANRAGANIYYGVNPRTTKNGTKAAVSYSRTLWLDLDGVNPKERRRWAMLPPPTITVSSGHGVHLYWRLAAPVSVTSPEERALVESLMRGMSKATGGDSTHDVTRLLRLPGFDNVKNLRNGETPSPCRITECCPERHYSLSSFDAWKPKVGEGKRRDVNADPGPIVKITGTDASLRIRRLVAHLERDVPDRSRRDFAVICGLIRSGLSPCEIWKVVEDKSKFKTNGRLYFDHTFQAALDAVTTQK